MFFCYRHAYDFRNTPGRGYRIGHAHSQDLIAWTREDFDLDSIGGSEGEWDQDMQCYPHIFKCNSKIYLLYNGNQFGKFGFGIIEIIF